MLGDWLEQTSVYSFLVAGITTEGGHVCVTRPRHTAGHVTGEGPIVSLSRSSAGVCSAMYVKHTRSDFSDEKLQRARRNPIAGSRAWLGQVRSCIFLVSVRVEQGNYQGYLVSSGQTTVRVVETLGLWVGVDCHVMKDRQGKGQSRLATLGHSTKDQGLCVEAGHSSVQLGDEISGSTRRIQVRSQNGDCQNYRGRERTLKLDSIHHCGSTPRCPTLFVNDDQSFCSPGHAVSGLIVHLDATRMERAQAALVKPRCQDMTDPC
ncbi:hypothetical protein RRG08_059260 [Elysia crispata]|uniref:Uncharacterized protein n=1 Tax=Elysia crispata TaxID=231223 RepID=A0AAE1CUQ9_9GAST|nr:hypothetical protein RRG08_059260 [Elysia crispata]